MFRKLYWVVEETDANHPSRVRGVYTSVPDLVRYGIRGEDPSSLRLTLSQLDSPYAPLGTWSRHEYAKLPDDLAPFVLTEEITAEHVQMLQTALHSPASLA